MSYMCACGRSSSCLCELLPVTADVQRELAGAVMADPGLRLDVQCGRLDHAEVILTLLPTVRRLIADAEKRAAARALRDAADSSDLHMSYATRELLRHRAAALDPT